MQKATLSFDEIRTRKALPAILAFVLIISGAIWLRFPIIDDAFITFRYAANLTLGRGLVYNLGEHVLGTTNPLWASFLAGFYFLGIPLAISAVFFGIGACVLTVFIFQKYTGLFFSLSTLFILISVIFSPLIHMTITSGMEMPLYMLGVLLSIRAHLRDRPVIAGMLAAMCFGMRPDGLLLPMLFGLSWISSRRQTYFASVIMFIAFVLPWAAFATYYYGSAIPHSVIAKQIFHPGSFLHNCAALLGALTRNDLDFLTLILGISGSAYLIFQSSNLRWHQREDAYLAVWLATYIIGLLASGIDPVFFWYAYPIWLLLILCGLKGISVFLDHYISDVERRRRLEVQILAAYAAIVLIFAITTHTKFEDYFSKMIAYRELVPKLKATLKPSDTFYLGETGYLGYELLDNYIIDSTGINSPQVSQELRKLKQDAPYFLDEWHVPVIKMLEPTWIVCLRSLCGVRSLEKLSWFQDSYEKWDEVKIKNGDELLAFRHK